MSNPNTESFEDQIETFEHMVTVLMVLSGDAREAEFEKSSLVYSKDQTTASVLDAKAMKYAKSWWEEHQATIDQRVAEGRLVELDLLEQAINQGRDMNAYKLQRLASLTKKGEKS